MNPTYIITVNLSQVAGAIAVTGISSTMTSVISTAILTGQQGVPGVNGSNGAAATVSVGSTTTGAAGSSASVANAGTSSAAVLNFTVPKGAAGTNGTNGAGVATGGTAGQVLKKNSSTDYDTSFVTLSKNDVSLGNVDNTSDINKPVSTAAQTALNAKADTSSLATVATSGSYTDLSNKPTIPTVTGTNTGDETTATIKTKLSITTLSGSNTGDQDLSSYATTASVTPKADKTYVDSQDTNLQGQITTNTSNISSNTTAISGKQSTLVSGTNIKTVNGTSLLGTGDLTTPLGDMLKATYDPASVNAQLAADSAVVHKSGDTMSGTLTSLDIIPSVSLTYGLGSSSFYFSNTYSQRLYLNSTAYLDGGTAGNINATGIFNGSDIVASNALTALGAYALTPSTAGVYMGIPSGSNPRFTMVPTSGNVRAVDNASGTFRIVNSTAGTVQLVSDNAGLFTLGSSATPTHTLTLPSTATGIALYNTSDQTTNYERAIMQWSSSIFSIQTGFGGTGVSRDLRIGTVSTAMTLRAQESSTGGSFDLPRGLGSAGSIHTRISGTFTQSSGLVVGLQISPTINHTLTAGYTALLINPTETTTGSGAKLLADFQVGGSSKASIDNGGALLATSMITSGKLSFGGILRVGQANQTAASVLTVFSQYVQLCNATTAAFTLTLPNANIGNGYAFTIKKTDSSANAVTIATGGGNIDAATTYSLASQYKYVTVVSNGTNWFVTANN